MTFQELLLNLMGTHTSKRLKVVAEEWEGELLIKGDEILRADVYTDPKLSGIEALKFMLGHQESIKKVEFLPFADVEPNVKLGQMDLLNIVWEESEGKETEEVEEKEEAEAPFFSILKKYFNEKSLRAAVCRREGSISVYKNSESAKLVEKLVEEIKEQEPCKLRKVLIRFENSFCLISVYGKNFGAAVIDIEELPNYELDQPVIDEELLSALTAKD